MDMRAVHAHFAHLKQVFDMIHVYL